MVRSVLSSVVLAARLLVPANAEPPAVAPTIQTEAVASVGDAADDPALWVHPTEPDKSLILGTDKKRGLGVYDLAGKQVQFLDDGKLNNVDIRQGVIWAKDSIDLVAANSRSDDTLLLYRVVAGRLERFGPPIPAQVKEVYGICLGIDRATGTTHLVACGKSGKVVQFTLRPDATGQPIASLIRDFHVGGQSEGMVVDDERGELFIAEEGVGIWRYRLVPPGDEDATARTLVDGLGPRGNLAADVEGLTIYRRDKRAGYLIASCQGENRFAVFAREDGDRYLGSFRIGPGDGLDGAEETDGIHACAAPLGSAFPFGAFVAQDGITANGHQNFKVVPWERIMSALESQSK
ncbi:MAG: phytase [Phycisphaerales bacterium]